MGRQRRLSALAQRNRGHRGRQRTDVRVDDRARAKVAGDERVRKVLGIGERALVAGATVGSQRPRVLVGPLHPCLLGVESRRYAGGRAAG